MNKYHAFLKILECGSFTVAADELNYTQSAVSQMISSLEKELDTTLFVRSRHSLQLTYEGEQLLPLIRKMVQDERMLKEKATELKGMQAGVVRMATFATFSGSLLPHILKSFQKDYPNVVFELHQGYYREIEQWVERDVVDFGITNIAGVKKFQCQPLFEDPFFVVVPPEHRLAKEKQLKPQQLQKEVFVALDEGDDRDFLNLLEKQNISLDIRYRFCDDNSILSMVENGDCHFAKACHFGRAAGFGAHPASAAHPPQRRGHSKNQAGAFAHQPDVFAFFERTYCRTRRPDAVVRRKRKALGRRPRAFLWLFLLQQHAKTKENFFFFCRAGG